MPKDLPGFYYDAEKNRYFPYKGPIPGSSKAKPPPPPKPDDSLCGCIKLRRNKLLQARELCGNIISSRKGKSSFQAEYLKRHASQPLIWKYKDTKNMANVALEHVSADVTSPHGLMRRDILLSGGVNGFLCLYQIEEAGQEIASTSYNYESDRIWPHSLDQTGRHKQLLGNLRSSYAGIGYVPSDITCIKVLKKRSLPTDDAMSKHLVITTLGSDSAPAKICLLDLSKPLDFNAITPIALDSIKEIAAIKETLWTADCDPEGSRVVIGTNRGAALLNLETGVLSRVFRCKSDVLSIQLNQGKSILCGLRNGAIVTVDTRQKQVRRSINSSSTISMPSSVCCLASLKMYDQYFLASSMDGSIKLYDHRIMHRGAVQSYDGNVNSHTRIELGVDPSEKVVMSGGEDCHLRLWNIKSGELLFNEKFMDYVPSAVCWSRNKGILSSGNDRQDYRCYWEEHYWGAWLGSIEGLFYMDWQESTNSHSFYI